MALDRCGTISPRGDLQSNERNGLDEPSPR